jgi:hypothetical protein
MSKPKHPGSQPEDALKPKVADDEVVHVPKGRSRKQFLLYIGLSIFTLIIYVVPQQFQAILKPKRERDAAYVSWNHPRLGPQSVSEQDFMMARRKLQDFFRVAGMSPNDLLDDEGLARLLVIDSLAIDSGVEVSDRELRDNMLQVSQSQDSKSFQERCRALRVAPLDFQEGLRQMLRINRYESLLEGVLATPAPAELDKQWKERNQEYAFDLVSVDVAGSMDAAAAQVPADPELKTWYDALPNKQRLFQAEWKAERASAELLSWRVDGDEPAMLLGKYPRPEGADLEQLAKDYYNQFANVRFRRPEEKADATDVRERLYLPFDEVAEKARRESKVYGALVDWQKAFKDRVAKGEAVDFTAEAAAFGLTLHNEATAKTQAEWSTIPDFGGPSLSDAVLRGSRAPDKLINVTVSEHDMACGRALEHIAAGPPPFEEVHDKALAEWKKQKAIELAQAKLKTIYDVLKAASPAPPPDPAAPDKPAEVKVSTDAATFAAKASEAGLSVLHTDWFQQSKLPADLSETPTEVERFLSEVKTTGRYLYDAKQGEVTEPHADSKNERVWLVLSLGKRDPAQVAIEPKDLDGLRQMATYTNQQRLQKDVFSTEGFAKTLGLKFLKGRNAPPAEEPKKS